MMYMLIILFVCSLLYDPTPQIPSLTSHHRQLEQILGKRSCGRLIAWMAIFPHHPVSMPLGNALPRWLYTWLCVSATVPNLTQMEAWKGAFALLLFLLEHWRLACWKDVRGMWGEQSHLLRPSETGQHSANPPTETQKQASPRWAELLSQHIH